MDVLHETQHLTLDYEGDVYLRVYLDDVEFDTLHVGQIMPDGWFARDRNLSFCPLASQSEIDTLEDIFADHSADTDDDIAEWTAGYHSDLIARR